MALGCPARRCGCHRSSGRTRHRGFPAASSPTAGAVLNRSFRSSWNFPEPETSTGTCRSLFGLKTPLAYAVGEKRVYTSWRAYSPNCCRWPMRFYSYPWGTSVPGPKCPNSSFRVEPKPWDCPCLWDPQLGHLPYRSVGSAQVGGLGDHTTPKAGGYAQKYRLHPSNCTIMTPFCESPRGCFTDRYYKPCHQHIWTNDLGGKD